MLFMPNNLLATESELWIKLYNFSINKMTTTLINLSKMEIELKKNSLSLTKKFLCLLPWKNKVWQKDIGRKFQKIPEFKSIQIRLKTSILSISLNKGF